MVAGRLIDGTYPLRTELSYQKSSIREASKLGMGPKPEISDRSVRSFLRQFMNLKVEKTDTYQNGEADCGPSSCSRISGEARSLRSRLRMVANFGIAGTSRTAANRFQIRDDVHHVVLVIARVVFQNAEERSHPTCRRIDHQKLAAIAGMAQPTVPCHHMV